jgi:DNA-binding NtrC family response regulator
LWDATLKEQVVRWIHRWLFELADCCIRRKLRSQVSIGSVVQAKTTSEPSSVLIIDDDQLHLTIYTWILERAGYKCKTVLVGKTVELPVSEPVDVVLLDYRLNSTFTAVDIAHRVKAAFPAAPIIVLSELEWVPDDIRAHVVGFAYKGNPKGLIETVSSVLKERSALS